jgi:DNA repair photolyase
MIISASRRTDIPAFHSEWFLNRLKEKYVLVRNPMNYKQVSKVSLCEDDVDCIVFWTKNPLPLMKQLKMLAAYPYYFQFSMTGYNQHIEPSVPPKSKLVPVFKALAEEIGKEKVIWRYDPILYTNEINLDFHMKQFELLASKLCQSTEKCVISFMDNYPKVEKRLKTNGIRALTEDEMLKLAFGFSEIASAYGIKLETCSEKINLETYGIVAGKCVDDALIRSLFGVSGNVKKDPNQRESCGCVKSIDIGAYNTCCHNCLYCYANVSECVSTKEIQACKPSSPLLCGEVEVSSNITEKRAERLFSSQIQLR